MLQKWCCRSVTSQKTRKQKPKAPSVATKIRLCAPLLWLISNSIAMWLKVSKTTLWAQNYCNRSPYRLFLPSQTLSETTYLTPFQNAKELVLTLKWLLVTLRQQPLRLPNRLVFGTKRAFLRTKRNVGTSQERSLQTSMTMRLTSE